MSIYKKRRRALKKPERALPNIWIDAAFNTKMIVPMIGAAVLFDGADLRVQSYNLNNMTIHDNNEAEVWAATLALEVSGQDGVGTLFTDSMATRDVIQRIQSGDLPKHKLKQAPYTRLQNFVRRNCYLKVEHSPRDAGHIPIVDAFASAAAFSNHKQIERLAHKHGLADHSFEIRKPPADKTNETFMGVKKMRMLEKLANRVWSVPSVGDGAIVIPADKLGAQAQWVNFAVKQGWAERTRVPAEALADKSAKQHAMDKRAGQIGAQTPLVPALKITPSGVEAVSQTLDVLRVA